MAKEKDQEQAQSSETATADEGDARNSSNAAVGKKRKEVRPTKTVLDKIVAAIRNQPPTAKGLSRSAIAKYLKTEFGVENASQLKRAFLNAVKSGKLIQTGQSFRVAGDPVPTLPTEETVVMKDIQVGTGEGAKRGDTLRVAYEGRLENGDGPVFDSSNSFVFTLGAGDVIKGWDLGFAGMQVGGKRQLTVPSKLGYGKRGSSPDIPPNATLYFSLTLKAIC
jgi:FKBP-type peptidyl-prolyl cis-trans isomerase